MQHWDSVGFAISQLGLSQIQQFGLSQIPWRYTSTKEEEVSQGESAHPYPDYLVSQAALEGHDETHNKRWQVQHYKMSFNLWM